MPCSWRTVSRRQVRRFFYDCDKPSIATRQFPVASSAIPLSHPVIKDEECRTLLSLISCLTPDSRTRLRGRKAEMLLPSLIRRQHCSSDTEHGYRRAPVFCSLHPPLSSAISRRLGRLNPPGHLDRGVGGVASFTNGPGVSRSPLRWPDLTPISSSAACQVGPSSCRRSRKLQKRRPFSCVAASEADMFQQSQGSTNEICPSYRTTV